MVGLGGLEPPASPLSGVRSNHLSYRPGIVETFGQAGCGEPGGADRDRTGDPLLAKQVLSQLSYSPLEGTRGSAASLDAGILCGHLGVVKSFSKGGDPAAPSDTATLLRLHPSH